MSQYGRVVQVHPIKPTLKAPGAEPLKPKYDEPLSNFAFNFNLRCYSMGLNMTPDGKHWIPVGRCSLTLSTPS